jgi:putative DNA primase/helicase
MLDTRPSINGSARSLNPEISDLCDQYYPILTDYGNARRFADLFSDTVRYVPARGWFLFSQTHWQPADTDTMLSLAHDSLDEFLEYTSCLTDQDTELCTRILKHLARSESLSRLHALLRLARTFPEICLPHTSLDADPYLLNLRNGTLNLLTRELLPHNPQHYLTHLLPYDYSPEAASPIWDSFLDRLTSSDPALQLYLQRALGSTLFGHSTESTAFVLTGPGQRAHQLFLSTLRQLLGSYSTHTLALQQRTLTPALLNSRLLTLPSSALVHSCDPSILSAFLNHDPLPLSPTSYELITQPHATLWLSAPELPQLPSDLASLREYFQPIPISLVLTSYEATQLQTQLQAALPAILNWAIEGFHLWHTEVPPSEPLCIQQAAIAFHEDQDPLALFLAQSCTTNDPDASVPAYALYQAYVSWARAYGERPISASRFGAHALASGLVRTRHATGRFYCGLKLTSVITLSSSPKEDTLRIAV